MGVQSLQTKPLRKCNDPTEYKIYRAALEWSLDEPIVIENREDLRSEHQWRERVEPYYHQVTNLITFCRRLPVTLLADDVGLGKTISAGLVVSELMARSRVSRILVVCPKLLIPQWKEELQTKFGIEGLEATGRELLTTKPPEAGGAVITTFHSARLHFDGIAKAGFEMLILDEAHKLRNLYGVEKPPQVAVRIRKALADRQFKYVLMLTATPIHNRLWDLYSLIDLLTVARGHQNPFGSVGMFARNFIADNKTDARKLKPDRRDEFRSIVYSYMSRIRRADANLYFPDRKVQVHKVKPTREELKLFSIVAKYITQLNPLSQYSLLLALTSSPQALLSQTQTMARNKTAPASFASDVNAVVQNMKTTAKLDGLIALINKLKKEQPENWRVVIFTESRETQTTIEALLSEHGISCGLINGDSAVRNQETIEKFRTKPTPKINVMISTRAGSEGVNLQVANVLVNYDLPWNPMIVEQRIGRVQRLASDYAYVCIFNMILEGTFEEFVVGRLMEKLQLASHAIGDIESLLEAAGMDDDDSESFEEQIRTLVLAALKGKDVKAATLKLEKSIAEAKITLAEEEKNINQMLGGTDGAVDLGPRCPKLPPHFRSMDVKTFTLMALEALGAKISVEPSGLHRIWLDGRQEIIRFEDNSEQVTGTLCRPGAPFFEKLVNRMLATGLHTIKDVDDELPAQVKELVTQWVCGFNGNLKTLKIQDGLRYFDGTALLLVRATVAHDSYERLIEVSCKSEGEALYTRESLQPMSNALTDPTVLGLPQELLKRKAIEEPAIAEFCRFYEERLVDEVFAAGDDERKKKKLEDDFTPRLAIELVGLNGQLYREVHVLTSYAIANDHIYESTLTIVPHLNKIVKQPAMGECAVSGVKVPSDCLGCCQISGKTALRHELKHSELSNRTALPQHIKVCASSGKQVLEDELEKSAISGKMIASSLLKTSSVSGKKAEPEFFAQCEFTGADVLINELLVSQISNKRYRSDEQVTSVVSGKSGHKLEFIKCSETNQPLLPEEAEKCEITRKVVRPGILQECAVSGKKVIPSELEICAVTGKKALRQFLTTCFVTNQRLLLSEAHKCEVTGKMVMPGILHKCEVTGKMVLPQELEKSVVSQKIALKEFFVSCSETGHRLLKSEAETKNSF
ncbi:MAG TPA: SNF2-related protein, partial [Candidatus Omnitrophota bacterium]|nr:SNF2-related protein [Candidatus Omnitrophota bacterium]